MKNIDIKNKLQKSQTNPRFSRISPTRIGAFVLVNMAQPSCRMALLASPLDSVDLDIRPSPPSLVVWPVASND
jgi:hypothetical protein